MLPPKPKLEKFAKGAVNLAGDGYPLVVGYHLLTLQNLAKNINCKTPPNRIIVPAAKDNANAVEAGFFSVLVDPNFPSYYDSASDSIYRLGIYCNAVR
jgi:hypothetical protein